MYEEAASIDLQPCNPIRLSIALNQSVFFYEVQENLAKAQQIADIALKGALELIDSLGEDDFKEAKSIIELLKENLSSWTE